MEIVSAAICAGIFNDLGSGSNVDLCIITKASLTLPCLSQVLLFACFFTILTFLSDFQGGKEYLRNYQTPNPRSYTSARGYDFKTGHTGMLLYLHGIPSCLWIMFHMS